MPHIILIDDAKARISLLTRAVRVAAAGGIIIDNELTGHANWETELENLETAIASGDINDLETAVDTCEQML